MKQAAGRPQEEEKGEGEKGKEGREEEEEEEREGGEGGKPVVVCLCNVREDNVISAGTDWYMEYDNCGRTEPLLCSMQGFT